MDTAPATSALLIRAWIDEGRLKARLIRLAEGETETLGAVVGRDALLAAVERWLDRVAVTPR